MHTSMYVYIGPAHKYRLASYPISSCSMRCFLSGCKESGTRHARRLGTRLKYMHAICHKVMSDHNPYSLAEIDEAYRKKKAERTVLYSMALSEQVCMH